MFDKRFNASIEEKWQKWWIENNTYKFNKDSDKPLYVIDSPPPFTSGRLHMGHVLSYSYFDFVARYKRMKGFNVLYPQGWDAQGFPTEVKVEKKYGRLPPAEFREKCIEWSWSMIERMKDQMIKMGFSPDWSLEYVTMTPEYHKLVQESVIEMYEKGHIYRDKHPVLWCPHCVSAIAKAETQDKEEETMLNYFTFDTDDGEIVIASTRPELLHACVGVFVNPEDERYKHLIGKKAKTPFGKEVPILADKEVDMEFGTGIVMICTYGDTQDVVWQKRYSLPVIEGIDERGRIINSGMFDGLSIKEARKRVIEWLKETGRLKKQERMKHTVKVHDRCGHNVELKVSMEWFARVKENADKIKEMAHQIKWVPEFGIHYLTDWLDNIDWDWVISRDRVFGTPIPFYVCDNCGHVVPVDKDKLPFDPNKNAESIKCPKCGHDMHPEKKVFDVWVDSSITPLVVSGWHRDNELFSKAYPTSLRPQGVEIVRTWAFYTIYRSGVGLTGKKPWDVVLLNGNVLAPDGRKMSKSLGNVIEPTELLNQYPADAIRQWAAMSGAMAKDRPFSYEDIKYAKQFLNKYWNAARYIDIVSDGVDLNGDIDLKSVDKWILARLDEVIKSVTNAFESFDFRKAIITIQHFFWYEFCDYYIEYSKHRVYGESDVDKRTAIYVLRTVLDNVNKLLAPIAPHITEEINSTVFNREESIHLSSWPEPTGKGDKSLIEVFKVANEIMRQIRDYKARHAMSQKDELKEIKIVSPIKLSDDILYEIKTTGRIGNAFVERGEEVRIDVPP